MTRKLWIMLPLAALAWIAGCSPATDTSRQPSQDEIQEGIKRRIAEIDKNPNLSQEQKDRMKQQIQGSSAPQNARPQGQ